MLKWTWRKINEHFRKQVDDCAELANCESVESQLPGRNNGPADAYRHILLAAELTRRFGEACARKILEEHEEDNRRTGQTPDEEAMDRRNNEIGIQIGRAATTWGDVVAGARNAMTQAAPTGQGGGAQWLPENRWTKNPKVGPGQNDPRIPTRDANGNFDPRLNWPTPRWPANGLPYPRPRTRPDLYGPIPDHNILKLPGLQHLSFDPCLNGACGNLWAVAATSGVTGLSATSDITIDLCIDISA